MGYRNRCKEEGVLKKGILLSCLLAVGLFYPFRLLIASENWIDRCAERFSVLVNQMDRAALKAGGNVKNGGLCGPTCAANILASVTSKPEDHKKKVLQYMADMRGVYSDVFESDRLKYGTNILELDTVLKAAAKKIDGLTLESDVSMANIWKLEKQFSKQPNTIHIVAAYSKDVAHFINGHWIVGLEFLPRKHDTGFLSIIDPNFPNKADLEKILMVKGYPAWDDSPSVIGLDYLKGHPGEKVKAKEILTIRIVPSNTPPEEKSFSNLLTFVVFENLVSRDRFQSYLKKVRIEKGKVLDPSGRLWTKRSMHRALAAAESTLREASKGYSGASLKPFADLIYEKINELFAKRQSFNSAERNMRPSQP